MSHALNQKEGNKVCQTDTILLDFSKAFDQVSHKRLLCKLNYYGIDDKILHWVKSFLGSHTKKVSVNGIHSTSISVTSGVPQG